MSLQNVTHRIEKLDSVRNKLKSEFFGMDTIIDNIIESITTWYLLPKSVKVPVPVALWGMTSTGKTSFVQRLVQLLELSECLYNGIDNLGSDILQNERSIFIIDEFHKIQDLSAESKKKFLDPIESFLGNGSVYLKDTGKQASDFNNTTYKKNDDFNFRSGYYNLNDLIESIRRLYSIYHNKDLESENFYLELCNTYNISLERSHVVFSKRITHEDVNKNRDIGYHNSTFEMAYKYIDQILTKGNDKTILVPKSQIKTLQGYHQHIFNPDSPISMSEKMEVIDGLAYPFEEKSKEYMLQAGFTENLISQYSYFYDAIRTEVIALKYTSFFIDLFDAIAESTDMVEFFKATFNVTGALVFVIGNFDELFGNSTYDIAANAIEIEAIHKKTKDHSIIEIKRHLLEYLRPETLSRLGNNHFVFPTINLAGYQKICDSLVKAYYSELEHNTALSISYTTNLVDAILNNCVIPAQGVRVLRNNIEFVFGNHLSDLIKTIVFHGATGFEVDYKDNILVYTLFIDKEEITTKTYPFLTTALKDLDNIKYTHESVLNKIRMHEAGHATVGILVNKCYPEYVKISKVLGEGSLVRFNNLDVTHMETEQSMFKQVQIGLAGMIVEKMIYGDISYGGHSDINTVSRLLSWFYSQIDRHDKGIIYAPNHINANQNQSTSYLPEDNNHYIKQKADAKYNQLYTETVNLITQNKALLIKVYDLISQKDLTSHEDFVNSGIGEGIVDPTIDAHLKLTYSDEMDKLLAEFLINQ